MKPRRGAQTSTEHSRRSRPASDVERLGSGVKGAPDGARQPATVSGASSDDAAGADDLCPGAGVMPVPADDAAGWGVNDWPPPT